MTIHSSTPSVISGAPDQVRRRRATRLPLARSCGGAVLLAIFVLLTIPAAAARGAVPPGALSDEGGAVMPGAPSRAVDPPRSAREPARAQVYSTRALVIAAEADLADAHPGRAIVAYERARLLVPRSRVVAAGLARARAAANLPLVEPPATVRAARLLSAGEWGWVAILGLTLGAGALAALAWGVLGRRRVLVIALAGFGAATLAVLGAWQVTPPPGQAIVVAAEATARIAPFAAAEPAFSLTEGAPVTIERTHGDYALIAGPEGRGWVPRAVVETILPATARRS